MTQTDFRLLVLYPFILPIVLLSFAVTKKYKFRIRGKFPTDFSWSGRPRNWTMPYKSQVWKMPVFGAVFYVFGFGMLFGLIRIGVIHERIIAGILGLLWLTIWAAYSLQVNMMKVAVGDSETIRSPLRRGAVFIILWAAVSATAYFFPYSRPAPEFVIISTGANVGLKRGETDRNSRNRGAVTLTVSCFGLRPSDEMMFRWTGPNGGIEISSAVLPDKGNYSRKQSVIHQISIDALLSVDDPGRWRVEVFLNGRSLLWRSFHLNNAGL